MPDHVMPKPRPGDLVLFSHDIQHFTNPVIAWVQDDRGECAVNLLAFSLGGFVYKTSVHHKDDPALHENPGWHEFGCWDYAPLTKQIQELTKHQHGNKNAHPAGK